MIRLFRRPRRPMSCHTVAKLLQAYLDAEMSDTTALLVADHLDDCRRCGLEADTYRWLVASLARLAPPDDPTRLARLRTFANDLATTA